MIDRPRLFVFITTRASHRYTDTALASFAATTPLRSSDTILLIDNDGDWSPSAPPPVKLMIERNQSPRGFAENMNIGLRRALDEQRDIVLCNNDLAFSADWLSDVCHDDAAIYSPLSNRELQYRTDIFSTRVQMELVDYLGNEPAFAALAAAHRASRRGTTMQVVALPFFCCRIPLPILQVVGLLDESFGKGGAEDYDYCYRAYLAGAAVRYALGAYILHFGGKSSWSGAESREEQLQREAKFKSRFLEKWGRELFELALDESAPERLAEPHRKAIAAGAHGAVIRALLGGRPVATQLSD